MKWTKGFLFAATALVWLCCSGIAAAQVSWSKRNYESLAPANSSKTIPPGTHITAQNWQQYKEFHAGWNAGTVGG